MINEYIAVDVETTGLSPERDRLLEIGAVHVQDGKVIKTFGTLIDTGMPVPLRIQELTGITDEMRKSGVPVREAVRGFLKFRGTLPIVGRNIPFDFGFLKEAAVREKLDFEAEALDTLKIARRTLPYMPSKSLSALCAFYRIPSGNAHRAQDDALAAHRLLWRMWEESGQRDPDAFALQKMVYTVKKQSPITNRQKGYLNDLLKYHRIKTDVCIDNMTKSEASRMIDHIILQHGKILKRQIEREGRNEFL